MRRVIGGAVRNGAVGEGGKSPTLRHHVSFFRHHLLVMLAVGVDFDGVGAATEVRQGPTIRRRLVVITDVVLGSQVLKSSQFVVGVSAV